VGDFVRYELDGGIATVTLDDGKVNVLSTEGFAALANALDRVEADGAVLVVRGRPGVLSAGFHLPSLMARDDAAVDMIITGFELAERLLGFPIPVVVACTGHALAMGAFLLLAGDLRIGTLGPYKIGTNEVAIGLVMPGFGIEMTRQRLTPPYFHRSVVNGEVYAPEEAVAAGFLDRAVAADELDAAVHEAAAEMAKLDARVFATTKRRARAQSLAAIRAAIESDEAGLRRDFVARSEAG
jgi:enoyl-CoA hydratase/carnithine racemase